MGKKKIALFYDADTESGKQILEFLTPFAKRKSDIVGHLILLWIAEHGSNVPVQWLDRSRSDYMSVNQEPKKSFGQDLELGFANKSVNSREDSKLKAAEPVSAGGENSEPDEDLIKAGLASFF